MGQAWIPRRVGKTTFYSRHSYPTDSVISHWQKQKIFNDITEKLLHKTTLKPIFHWKANVLALGHHDPQHKDLPIPTCWYPNSLADPTQTPADPTQAPTNPMRAHMRVGGIWFALGTFVLGLHWAGQFHIEFSGFWRNMGSIIIIIIQ